jgi:4-amino-4-deoxy-L-arabinose transferase-like glycosyltransferase
MTICSSIAEVSLSQKNLRAKNVFTASGLRYKIAEMPDKIRRWISLHPNWTLTFVTFAALAPFLAKPFNIDDPLFIWAAHQIQAHPLNPYSFDVNWYGTAEPMWGVTENPPLASYYIALVAAVFGWSELALHLAFLLPAIAVLLGTHRLARNFCRRPLLAALVTLFTPVFLISSTTVMCDVMMLAFWVWAVALWIEGNEKNEPPKLFFAMLLVSLAALTKYFGACLIPLLAAYYFIGRRRPDWRSALLLVPLFVLCLYQLATRALYGHGLLTEAVGYAAYAKSFFGVSGVAAGLTALAFTGGCLAATVFFAPLLWRARWPGVLAVLAILIGAAFFSGGMIAKNYPWLAGAHRNAVELQIVFWAAGGLGVLALAAAELWERREAGAWLLALWVFGTFLFAAFFNWTVNGRSILPMAPAAAILLAARLDKKFPADGKNPWPRGALICLAAGAALALLVASADFSLAVAVRESARQVCAQFGAPDRPLWFQGHWGFQFYMQQPGASAFDTKRSQIKAGENLALPLNNTSLFPPNPAFADALATNTVAGPRGLTTWSGGAGAGFYAASRGPLPFAFGHVPPEKIIIYAWKPGIQPAGK